MHRRLRRDVAIKALNERFCEIPGVRSRFANEARVLAAAEFGAELAAAAEEAWGPGWQRSSGVFVVGEAMRVAPITGRGAGATRVLGTATTPAGREIGTAVPVTPKARSAPQTGGATPSATASPTRRGLPWSGWTRRRVSVFAGAAGVVVAAAIVATVLLVGRHGGGGGGFTSDSTVRVGSAVMMKSAAPCPPLPQGWKNENAVVDVVDPTVINSDGSPKDIGGQYIPTDASGNWSAPVHIPDSTAAGHYQIRVTCVGDDTSGSTQTYYYYPDRNSVTFTR